MRKRSPESMVMAGDIAASRYPQWTVSGVARSTFACGVGSVFVDTLLAFQSFDLAARDDPRLHIDAVLGDVAGTGEPNLIGVLVLYAVLDRLTQRPQPHRLAENVAVESQGKYKRLLFRPLEQFLELVNHHVGELAPGMMAHPQRAGVIELHWIGH